MTEQSPRIAYEDRTRVAAGEVPFEPEELFFSRTDLRGVIIDGNAVFQRVAQYSLEELVGAPHKIIRHPDMPRAVFKLLWDTIEAGKPVGAYVKNRAKDGRHYWVFAVVSPADDGYVSVRLKPTSPMLETVEAVYAAQRARELEHDLDPSDSAADLLQTLRGAGYGSYDLFQSECLATELASRRHLIGRPKDDRMARFLDISKAIREVEAESEAMMKAFEAIRTIPLNMRILASRLETAGGPISAISVNYGSMSDEMAAWVRAFVQGKDSTFARIREAITAGLFLTSVNRLVAEMEELYRGEIDDKTCKEARQAALAMLSARYGQQSAEQLRQTETEAGRLARSVQDMKRYITGLSSTRMMCKIESATLSSSGETLLGIVDQLDASQDGIEEHLERISALNHRIQAHTTMLRKRTP